MAKRRGDFIPTTTSNKPWTTERNRPAEREFVPLLWCKIKRIFYAFKSYVFFLRVISFFSYVQLVFPIFFRRQIQSHSPPFLRSSRTPLLNYGFTRGTIKKRFALGYMAAALKRYSTGPNRRSRRPDRARGRDDSPWYDRGRAALLFPNRPRRTCARRVKDACVTTPPILLLLSSLSSRPWPLLLQLWLNRFFYPRPSQRLLRSGEIQRDHIGPTTVIIVIVIIGTRARLWPRLALANDRTTAAIPIGRTTNFQLEPLTFKLEISTLFIVGLFLHSVSRTFPPTDPFLIRKTLADPSCHLQARVRISTDNDSRATNGLTNENRKTFRIYQRHYSASVGTFIFFILKWLFRLGR